MAILEHKIEISSYLFFACVGEGENAFWGHLHSLQHKMMLLYQLLYLRGLYLYYKTKSFTDIIYRSRKKSAVLYFKHIYARESIFQTWNYHSSIKKRIDIFPRINWTTKLRYTGFVKNPLIRAILAFFCKNILLKTFNGLTHFFLQSKDRVKIQNITGEQKKNQIYNLYTLCLLVVAVDKMRIVYRNIKSKHCNQSSAASIELIK